MPKRHFQVLWSDAAIRDLEEIVIFITVDSESDARRLWKRLRERAAALETTPARGRVVPELAEFGMRAWREILVRPYRLVYRIEADNVVVLAVFDGRRDLEDILLERLVRIS